MKHIARYSNDLLLMKGSPHSTTVQALADVVRRERALRSAGPERPLVLFVDYVQKVAASTPHAQQDVRDVEAIEELTDGEKLVITSHYFYGYDYEILALRTGLTEQAIKNRAYKNDIIILTPRFCYSFISLLKFFILFQLFL